VQRDSILTAPGLEVVIDASAVGGMAMCGIDPQNLLQVGHGVLLHRRWVRPCAGGARLADARDLRLEAALATVHAAHAAVERIGRRVTVRLLP